MKKILIIISTFIISLSLVACTDSKSKQKEQKFTDSHAEEKIWGEYSKEISRMSDEFSPEYTAMSSYENISSKDDLKEKLTKLKDTSKSICENLSKIEKDTNNKKVKKSIESTNSILKNTITAADEFLSSVETENIEKMNASIDKYVDAIKPVVTNENNKLVMEAKNDVFKSNEEVPAVEEYDTQKWKAEMKNNYLKLINSNETTSPEVSTTENVTTEYKSALKKAERYSSTQSMSKARLYDQLTSEYGEKFSKEAAQYAIDNVKADWKENALKKAQRYQSKQSMSPNRIYDQLTSDYGEKFTKEEAQYAIDNLK